MVATASLPMYDVPALEADNGLFWKRIRDGLADRGICAPSLLGKTVFADASCDFESLFFTQVCGLPFRKHLIGNVTLVGTPDYGIAGCRPGYYRSAVVVRADDTRRRVTDFAGATLAYTDELSQSGYAAALDLASAAGISFGPLAKSGAHRFSARMVAAADADLAAIDAVSLRCMTTVERETAFENLRILAWTEPVPGLPYIAAAGVDRQVYFEVVRTAIRSLPASTRTRLGLNDLVFIPATDYLAVKDP